MTDVVFLTSPSLGAFRPDLKSFNSFSEPATIDGLTFAERFVDKHTGSICRPDYSHASLGSPYLSPPISSRCTESPFSVVTDLPDLSTSSRASSASSLSPEPMTPKSVNPFVGYTLTPHNNNNNDRLQHRASFAAPSSVPRIPLRPRMSFQGLQKRYSCSRCPWQTNFSEYMDRHNLAHEGRAYFDCVLGDCVEVFVDIDSYLEHIEAHAEYARRDTAFNPSQINYEQAQDAFQGQHHAYSLQHYQDNSEFDSHRAVPRVLTYGQEVIAPQLTISTTRTNVDMSDSTPWSAPCHVTTFAEAEHSRASSAMSAQSDLDSSSSSYESHFFSGQSSSSSASSAHSLHGQHHADLHGRRPSRDSMLAKIHRCTYPGCDKAFKRREHCKRHERIHTEERPWQCEVCERCFTRKDNLAAHRRTHEKVSTARRNAKRVKV